MAVRFYRRCRVQCLILKAALILVTSSSTSSGAAALGSGVGPHMIDCVLGVMKAYTTRVGANVSTELSDETGKLLQQRGGEFGAVWGVSVAVDDDIPALRRAMITGSLDALCN